MSGCVRLDLLYELFVWRPIQSNYRSQSFISVRVRRKDFKIAQLRRVRWVKKLLPYQLTLGIVTKAAGTSTAVGLVVPILTIQTKLSDANGEILKFKDEYDTQVYLHTKKMEEIDEFRQRQKQLESEMS